MTGTRHAILAACTWLLPLAAIAAPVGGDVAKAPVAELASCLGVSFDAVPEDAPGARWEGIPDTLVQPALEGIFATPDRLSELRSDVQPLAKVPMARFVEVSGVHVMGELLEFPDASAMLREFSVQGDPRTESYLLLGFIRGLVRDSAGLPEAEQMRLRALLLYHLSTGAPDRCRPGNEFLSLIGKQHP